MDLFKTYHDYFEALAIVHPDIAHKIDDRIAFELISVEEAFGKFRSTVPRTGSIIRLLEYSHIFTQDDQILRDVQGGFFVLTRHSEREGGKTEFYDAMHQSDKVAHTLIHKMISDSREGHPLFDHSLNAANSFRVNQAIRAGDINWSGFIVNFNFKPIWDVCISDDPFVTAGWTLSPGETWMLDGESWST